MIQLNLTKEEFEAIKSLVDYASGYISQEDEPLLTTVTELLEHAHDGD